MKEYNDRLKLAVLAAFKKSQELTIQYCGSLVEGEKFWYEVGCFGKLPKAIVKSIWRKFNRFKDKKVKKIKNRNIPFGQIKQEIIDLTSDGKKISFCDIGQRLRIDTDKVTKAIYELQKEGVFT